MLLYVLFGVSIISALFFVIYFIVMYYVLQVKAFTLFWDNRNDPKYDEIWGDRILMFIPLLFPLKRFNKILDSNIDLKNNSKILLFIKQIRRLKFSFLFGVISICLISITVMVGKINGASWAVK